jgi:gluconolactonase
MRTASLLTAGWALMLGACATPKTYPTLGTVERLDPRFDQLVPKDAAIEQLAEGFEWSEGPVYIRKTKSVLFSDIPNNAVMQWNEKDGVTTYLKPAGYTGDDPRGGESGSNGLLLDPEGHLILCQHGDRRVARLKADHTFETVADRYDGKRFNSPNDAVYKSNGDLYFTDPPYGLEKQTDDPAKELDFQGVYRLGKDGALTLLTKEMTRPNGIGFSPDEKTLYVANSDPKHAVWMAYDVQEDGTIGNGRVFFDATSWVGKMKGLPDGMTIDRRGHVFATGPGGVNVFAPDGTHLGRFNTGEATANCTFDHNESTLYITADMYFCRVKMKKNWLGF